MGGYEFRKWWNGSFMAKVNRNYNTDFFFLADIFVLNTPFSSPKVSLWTSSEGGKHWGCFLPPSTKTCLLALNGTLCASLLVFEWVRGHVETRLAPVLQWEGFARYLSKKVNSLGSWVEQETLPSARVLRRSKYMRASSQTSLLAPNCVFLSGDLPVNATAAAAAVRKSPS